MQRSYTIDILAEGGAADAQTDAHVSLTPGRPCCAPTYIVCSIYHILCSI